MRLLVLVAAAAFVLTGCAPDPTVVDGPHRLIVARAVPGVTAGVGFGGRLGYDDAGCVVLGADEVLVAPPGSTLKDGVMTLHFGAGQRTTLRIGDTTDELGGMEVGAFDTHVPSGTACSSTKYLLLG